MFGSISYWGPEYTQPKFDDKETFLKFMDPSDPRSSLKRSKLPKYHWVTRRMRMTPSRCFTGTLASNIRLYDSSVSGQSINCEGSTNSVNEIKDNGELILDVDANIVEDNKSVGSVISMSMISDIKDKSSELSEKPIDKLRRTISDGSLSIISTGSEISNPTPNVSNNSNVGGIAGDTKKDSIGSIARRESRKLKEAQGMYIQLCIQSIMHTYLHQCVSINIYTFV